MLDKSNPESSGNQGSLRRFDPAKPRKNPVYLDLNDPIGLAIFELGLHYNDPSGDPFLLEDEYEDLEELVLNPPDFSHLPPAPRVPSRKPRGVAAWAHIIFCGLVTATVTGRVEG